MKKLFALLFTLALLILCSAALAEIVIDGTFPDENFKAYIREAVDKDGSGTLNNREIYETLKIDCSGCEIKNLEGINLFADLEELVCDSNPITKLDLSGNSRLKEVSARDCGITSVTVGSLPELKRLDLHTNGLTKINLSKTPKLEELNIYGNAVKELNLAALPNLKSLDCSMNALASMDLTANKKLVTLECTNNKLTSLDVSKNTALETLICYRNKLTSLTLGSLKKLHHLECGNNSFKKLDVSKCTVLDAIIAAGGERQANDCYRWGRGDQFIEMDEKVVVTWSGGKFNERVAKLTLNKTSATLTRTSEKPHPVLQLKAVTEPEDATQKAVTWTSSDPEIASVDRSTGLVTAGKTGTVTITCVTTDGSNLKATCKVTVKNRKVSAITLNKTSATLIRTSEKQHPTVKLSVTELAPADALNKNLKWTVDKPEVVSLDTETGTVTAQKTGTAVITVAAADGGGAKATVTITVKNRKVSGITLNKTKATLTRTSEKPHPTVKLSVTELAPADALNKNLKCTVDKPEVVSLDMETGTVTAQKTGTAVITVAAADGGGAKATVTITVKNRKVSGITLDKTKATIKKGESLTLNVKEIAPADALNKGVTWSSSDKKIATVNKNGKVTAVKAGTCVITCTAADGSKIEATCKITVK